MSQLEFYRGYATVPTRWRGFLVGAVLVLGSLAVVLSGALAGAQQRGGDAAAAAEPFELEGVLIRHPYPLLLAPDPSSPAVERAWLLVASTKAGVADRVAAVLGAHDAARVRVRGAPLRRADARVLELVDDFDGLRMLEPAAIPELEVDAGEPEPFVGEIIDPKCWLGAMRPGSGLVHRACAALCIRGGVPPAFVGAKSGEVVEFFVIADAAGRPANLGFAESAGVLGTLRARRARLGSVPFLLADPADWSVHNHDSSDR